MFTMLMFCVYIEKYAYTTSLIGCCLNEFYVPVVMYGVRLLIVVLQELQCCNCIVYKKVLDPITSQSFVALHLPVSEIAKCIA